MNAMNRSCPRRWRRPAALLLLTGLLGALAATPPLPAADDADAVRQAVNTWVEANKNQDTDAARKLLTRAAQKNFKPEARINVGGPNLKTEIVLEEPQVEGDTARCLSKESMGTIHLYTQYRLKREDDAWKIYALSLMLNEKEPGVTLDLEKGLTPEFEADPVKVQAFLMQLNQMVQKATSGKSGGTGKSAKSPGTPPPSRPPPPPVVEAPKPAPPPEPILPLEFGNRRRPIQFDFTEFTGSGAERGVKVSAMNHANKAIRKLTVKMYYLDSGSNPLGEKEAMLLAADAPLLDKNSRGDLEFNQLAIPPDARKAIIEVQEAQFTDLTTWRIR